ncbi:MAG: head maturation protease, ClpP-related [Oscillospiraceae bacterium]
MPKKNEGNSPFLAAAREGYSVKAESETGDAELILYGDVVSERPFDYKTRMPSEGYYIVESEILSDLKAMSKCKKLDIRLNSCGGECNVAIAIHNRLREMAVNGTEITCTVDGVAMSAGSHIMCAADKVKASTGSLIMIHKSLTMMLGYYNADRLRKIAGRNDAYDKAMLAAYKRKTCKSEEDLLKMMSDETFMTGSEAKEHGFVDELVETENNIEIAASADKSALYVGGRIMQLYGASCPEYIPIAEAPNAAGTHNTALVPKADESGSGNANKPNNNEGGKSIMAENLAELRKENPELAARIEKEVKAQFADENKTATDTAVQKALDDERKRLEKIEAISGQISPELLADAKYKNPCTAEELAYKAMSENAKKGATFVKDMEDDYSASGADSVKAVAPKPDGAGHTEAEQKAEILAAIDEALKEDNK